MNMNIRTKHFLARLLAAFVLVLAVWTVRADDPPEKPVVRRMENRFLFLIDVSSAMSHSTNTVQKAVMNLLAAEIGGQLREGDTIGVWTFSDKLHLSEKDKNHPLFPMQIWHADEKELIMRRILNFLRFQHYEKKADLKKVLPEMYARVSASQTMTVIIVSDGSNPITGTPFDDDINDLQKRFGAEFRAANLPLVTVLAAREGEVFDYTVNSGADTIRIPQTASPIVIKVIPPVVIAPPPPPVEPKHIEIVVSPQTNSVTRRGELATKPVPAPEAVPPVAPQPAAPVAKPSPKPAEPTFGPDVSPGVVQVIKLWAAKVGEESLMAYVNNYNQPFTPTADEILLLHDAGIPDRVVAEMVRHQPPGVAKAVPPPAPAPPVAQPEVVKEAPPASAPPPAADATLAAKAKTAPAAPTVVVVQAPLTNSFMLFLAFILLIAAIILIIVILRRPRSQPSLISQSINRRE